MQKGLPFLLAAVFFALRAGLLENPGGEAQVWIGIGHVTCLLILVLFPAVTRLRSATEIVPWHTFFKSSLRGAALYIVTFAVLLYVYYSFVHPDIFYAKREWTIQQQLQQVQDSSVDREALEQNMESFFTIGRYVWFSAIAQLAMALLFSLFAAFMSHWMLRKAAQR